MDEERKKKVSVFRFGVIHDLVGGRRLSRGQKETLIREKSSHEWDIPFSGRSYISPSTIKRWIRLYESSGGRLESLHPSDREDKGKIRAMHDETALSLVNLGKEFKGASLPVIIREARDRGILPVDFKVSPATLYRLFRQHGVGDDESLPPDRRRFEAELPNDIWQSDCMHGPKVDVEGKLRKAYLFAFIDDMSRLITHAEFYLHERLDSYMDALSKALSRRGVPRKLYVDNGPSFRSQHLAHVTAFMGIALVHSKPYQPEGRGKIERWFKTLRMRFLSLIPDGLGLSELNKRLLEWIEGEYHQAVHSSIKETPINRYIKNIHLIREAPKDLRDYFRKRAQRKVDRDRTVSILGKVYEGPVELIGRMVTLLYHEDDPSRIEVFYMGKSYGMLIPLNPNINCKVRRRIDALEIVPEKRDLDPPQGDIPYKGGKLFDVEGGDEDVL
jgi:transposase InsO family protein